MKLFPAILLALLLFVPACSQQHTGEVVKMKSGLEYMDDSLGTGNEAKKGELVQIHFSAWIAKDLTDLFPSPKAICYRVFFRKTLKNPVNPVYPVYYIFHKNGIHTISFISHQHGK